MKLTEHLIRYSQNSDVTLFLVNTISLDDLMKVHLAIDEITGILSLYEQQRETIQIRHVEELIEVVQKLLVLSVREYAPLASQEFAPTFSLVRHKDKVKKIDQRILSLTVSIIIASMKWTEDQSLIDQPNWLTNVRQDVADLKLRISFLFWQFKEG